MSVERAIHEAWSMNHPLIRLVPASRFYTGSLPAQDARAQAIGLPYVALARVGDCQVQRTSSGTQLARCILRFSIYSARHAQAELIAERILRCFNRAALRAGPSVVLDMKQAARAQVEQADGAWRIELDFFTRVSG